MIDLHLHTTASDGRLSPLALVTRAAEAGLTIISVTDHDTVAGLAAARAHAAAAGLTLVNGIEITAVHAGREVHLLGYFIDEASAGLSEFLQVQRGLRVERLREIGARLEALGAPVDVDSLIAAASAHPGVSVGRPVIARELVAAGHVATMQEAFDRFLATGQAAFVPRRGCSPREVVDVIHAAGGVASLAHPGVTRQPAIIEPLVSDGLDAIEVYHSEHPADVQAELLALATRLRVCVTGGSDFHGDDHNRPLGAVTLPREAFDALAARVSRKHV